MAALTSAGVTVNDTWTEGGRNGRRFLVKDVTLVLSSQGGATNYIAASLFGMTKIDYVRSVRTSGDVVIFGFPSYDGTKLLMSQAENGVAADVSATVRLQVAGH